MNDALDHISTRKRLRRCVLLQAKVTGAGRASEETCIVPWTGHPIHRALKACVETIGQITMLVGSGKTRFMSDIGQVPAAGDEREAAGCDANFAAQASKFTVQLSLLHVLHVI